jgi:protein phosphatase
MVEATLRLHRKLQSEADKARLGSLPLTSRFEADGKRVYAVHAAPRDPLFQYLPRDVSDEEMARALEPVEAESVLMGHTHWPFVRRVDGKLVANPGSVRKPKDGDPRAAYAIWQDGEIALCRAAYDVEESVRQLQEQPIPDDVVTELVRVLRTGT